MLFAEPQERLTDMSTIENAVSWAIDIANDNSHGYSQASRWGTPDYDCSSMVISAWEQAGVKVKTGGATYTGNMLSVFKAKGFADVTASCNLVTGAGLQRGDVLLNVVNHTAMYIGNGQLVHARSSEGNSMAGDQSGNEIRIQSYYNYPWNYVLRYTGSSTSSVATNTSANNNVVTTIQKVTGYYPVLKKGCKDAPNTHGSVWTLQTLLIANGHTVGTDGADGDFGNNTLNALKLYQAKNKLVADGVAGANTWAKLLGVG